MDQLFRYGASLLGLIIPVIIIIIIAKGLFSSLLEQHHSNWNTLIDDFSYSTQEFYEKLSAELKSHGIHGVQIKSIQLKEGSFFSSNRRYLRVLWKEYQYDICASPFGNNGFFISWWLLYKNSKGQMLLSKFPFIGKWLVQQWYPVTYYKVDTASMFMSYAQSSVLKVIDEITNEKGIRALSEQERKPILNNIFKQ